MSTLETDSAPRPSLFDRLGRKAAVDAAVEIFYQKVLADDRIRHFFAGVDLAEQRNKQKRFLAYAFGAPTRYTGRSLRQAHQPLVARGLDDPHFDAVAGHLAATLAELRVPPELSDEVMAIAASTRKDVLGR